MTTRTVLCFGDSNTHGTIAMRTPTDRRRHAIQDRWTSIMAAELGPDWHVIAEGHPGRTSVFDDPIEGAHKNALRSIKAILESHRPIDLIIVVLGTNDLKARFGLSANDIALGIQRLLIEIRSSECGVDSGAPQILLAAPIKAGETSFFTEVFAGASSKSALLPKLLESIAQNNGIPFTDLNDVAKVDPVDGIHLDAKAHAAIGARLAQTIQETFD